MSLCTITMGSLIDKVDSFIYIIYEEIIYIYMIFSCFIPDVALGFFITILYCTSILLFILDLIMFSEEKLDIEELQGFSLDPNEFKSKPVGSKKHDFSNIRYVPGRGHPGDSSKCINPQYPYLGPVLPPNWEPKVKVNNK